MAIFSIEYERTERTTRLIEVDAPNEKEALRLVEEYEADDSEAKQVDSLEWSISNARVV